MAGALVRFHKVQEGAILTYKEADGTVVGRGREEEAEDGRDKASEVEAPAAADDVAKQAPLGGAVVHVRTCCPLSSFRATYQVKAPTVRPAEKAADRSPTWLSSTPSSCWSGPMTRPNA